jgi:cellulose biosynthesis protein BcsQ
MILWKKVSIPGINQRRIWKLRPWKSTQRIFHRRKRPVFDEIIPRSSKIVDATDYGKTIREISGARHISDKYDAIAAQVIKDLKLSFSKRGDAAHGK